MLKNYLIVAFRNLMRHKIYSAINVLGLAIGMATCILIVRYIQNELDFDTCYTNADRIYRVVRETKSGGQSDYLPFTSGALAGTVQRDFPEVEKAVRVWGDGVRIHVGEKTFGMNICVADTDMFKIFDFPFVRGNLETAFPNPNAVAITESAAKRLFGNENPIGKTFTVESTHHGGERTITAILKDVPRNTTFPHFDYVETAVFSGGAKFVWEQWVPTDGWRPVETYLLLRKGADATALEAKLQPLIKRYMGDDIARTNAYHLQPLRRSYLYSGRDYNLDWYGGDIDRVYQFGAIALLVLVIGCINFTNLTTAQSGRRSREIGLRKVSGAYRAHLMAQFLGESILVSLLSLALALLAVKLALPTFNAFFNRQLELNVLSDPELAAALILVAILVGLLAGAYPALFLSSFEPTETLKGTFRTGMRGQWIRQTLMIMQFAISIALIVSTGVVYKQLEYIRHKRLGFDMDNMVIIPIFSTDQDTKSQEARHLADRYETVKRAFLANSNALEATAYRWWLGWGGGIIRSVRAERHETTDWRMPILEVDEDFLDVFRIDLVEGRKFDPVTFPSDTSSAFILNETAVRQLGWRNPTGKSFEWVDQTRDRKGTVIGVVKDFNYSPLREKIGPAALILRSKQFYNLGVRIKPEGKKEALAFFKKTWEQFVPDQPFQSYTWDQQLDDMYDQEQRVQALTMFSSGMTILIACLGLFGLAAFMIEQRTKEIGVRKVLGASAASVVMLLSWTFTRLVLIANLIAWPIAYYAMRNWLDHFAYRTDLSWWVFAAGGLIAAFIALLTVGYQSLRAALSNPIEALRYE